MRTLEFGRAQVTRYVRRLVCDEEGGAYTLSYVMVIPVLMLLVAMVVESALMLSAKLGTGHAAYVAARVATVHSGNTDWPTAEARAERAAVRAMIPFASGSDRSESTATESDDDYRAAYREWADDAVADSYVLSKQRDSARSVRVRVDGPPSSWQSDISAVVTYNYPFRLPGIGRLIGEPSADGGFTFPLTSRATLPGDGPQNRNQSLGIGYGQSP
jgi:Flp pilus assembly protein TadG